MQLDLQTGVNYEMLGESCLLAQKVDTFLKINGRSADNLQFFREEKIFYDYCSLR